MRVAGRGVMGRRRGRCVRTFHFLTARRALFRSTLESRSSLGRIHTHRVDPPTVRTEPDHLGSLTLDGQRLCLPEREGLLARQFDPVALSIEQGRRMGRIRRRDRT